MSAAGAMAIAIIIIYVLFHILTLRGAWDVSVPFFIVVLVLWVLIDYAIISFIKNGALQ